MGICFVVLDENSFTADADASSWQDQLLGNGGDHISCLEMPEVTVLVAQIPLSRCSRTQSPNARSCRNPHF